MARIGYWLLILVVGMSTQTAAEPYCNVRDFRVIPDVTVTGYMYVKSGKHCSVTLSNSLGGVKSIDITKLPSNGSLERVVRGIGLKYTPRQGFVGKDSFGFRDHAIDHRNNKPIVRHVVMDVTVNP